MNISLRHALCVGALPAAFLIGAAGALTGATGGGNIFVDNFTFGPALLTVAPGTKVTWTNRDDIPHTVVDAATARQFKSAPLDTGDTFTHVFDTPGTYHFFCSIHPRMQGTVVVR